MAGIIAAAVIGGGAALGAGFLGKSTANKALDQQKQMFQTGMAMQMPFQQFGADLIPTLKSLLTPGANQTDTLSQIPGFQFGQDWGQKAIANKFTSQGYGGNFAAELSKFGTGYALNQGFFPMVNAIQTGVNTGAGAAGNIMGNAVGAGKDMASSIMSGGGALMSGITGAGNNVTNALMLKAMMSGQFGGQYGQGGGGGGFFSPTNTTYSIPNPNAWAGV